MRVTKNPNVDQLLDDESGNDEGSSKNDSHGQDSTESHKPATAIKPSSDEGEEKSLTGAASIRWLDPTTIEFHDEDRGSVSLSIDGGEHFDRVFCLQAFPASHPNGYISVRRWDESGEDHEVGMIVDTSLLSDRDRDSVERLLGRHYLMRRVSRVHKASLSQGYLDLSVETDAGPETLTLRWTASQAVEFGDNGKLLIDTEDNRYVVEDVAALPKADRDRFTQYIYW